MKRFLILSLLINVSIVVKAQSLSEIQDSCYLYLERQDTAAFNRAYPKIFDAFERAMDVEMYSVKKELCEMAVKDQSIRFLLLDAKKKYGEDNDLTRGIRKIMRGIDSVNAARVVLIIDRYGWLGSEDIGEEANDAIFLCIQHCSDTLVQSKYLPILKEAVGSGNAKGWQYAFLTDRCLMNQGKPQIYGTQTIQSRDKKTYVVPLQDVKNVDNLRKEVGLGTLSEYMLESFDQQWSPEIYVKELPLCQDTFKRWYNGKQ